MKISKLAPEGDTILDWEGRAIGRTTGHILSMISRAMLHPERPVKIYSDSTMTFQYREDRRVYDETLRLIDKLGLDWFTINKYEGTITYNPYKNVCSHCGKEGG